RPRCRSLAVPTDNVVRSFRPPHLQTAKGSVLKTGFRVALLGDAGPGLVIWTLDRKRRTTAPILRYKQPCRHASHPTLRSSRTPWSQSSPQLPSCSSLTHLSGYLGKFYIPQFGPWASLPQ